MYYGNDYFKNRALEEIQRVKRYPSFVSLLSLDLSHIDSDEELENYDTLEKFYRALRELIKNSVRETDLISNIYGGKIAILLVETPKKGALVLSERLKKSIKYFLCDNTKSPLNWRISSKENSFPGPNNDEDNFITALDEIN
ncbi:MAG: diguanylate cyclase [Candidatus Zixiibacteriota bacterium]|nr:MAG: diguanylate cyclase [candidate division Zixibacteria bacterium]